MNWDILLTPVLRFLSKKVNIKCYHLTINSDKNPVKISLTDIARFRDAERSDYILQNWIRNRSTIEFIRLWEQFNNPHFNSNEFDGIKGIFFEPLRMNYDEKLK